jgi:glyoxylase-like metal-dependent hydrolase (beta-lactamase superfamily II)
VRPGLDAIHIIVEGGRAAVIDTGANHSVPRVLAALAVRGVAPEQVDWVILTHIHLDHAGGAGLLMRQLPGARLAVHPRGARHMADPSKLIAGATAVYGEAAVRKLYGDILPVDKARIVETPHQHRILLAGRELTFLDTPGHARHHVAIHDAKSGHVFAGDVFGISYRELDEGARQFVFPTSSPVQFEPGPYHRSIDMIAALAPEVVYNTHYSALREVPEKAATLHRLVDALAGLALREQDAGDGLYRRLLDGVKALVLEEARRFGSRLPEGKILEVYGMDIELNAQGLVSWLDSTAEA